MSVTVIVLRTNGVPRWEMVTGMPSASATATFTASAPKVTAGSSGRMSAWLGVTFSASSASLTISPAPRSRTS